MKKQCLTSKIPKFATLTEFTLTGIIPKGNLRMGRATGFQHKVIF